MFEIRPCASEKKIRDCNECSEPEKCKNVEALKKVRSGALAVGMLLNKGKGDQAELIKKWTAEIRGKFPYCVIET
jgi:hypothetical protein